MQTQSLFTHEWVNGTHLVQTDYTIGMIWGRVGGVLRRCGTVRGAVRALGMDREDIREIGMRASKMSPGPKAI